MNSTYTVIQIVIAVLIVITIILQTRGSSSGMAFGGGTESYRSKKGMEKILFYATIILAAIFALISILSLINQ
ncbi:MAG TPA: preprotein translocase subunit SecG [Candidatus Levybacteria bacterium]|nr:preprotein translocase subunit SecG [Candidatus Levybacteria bacterium]